jgi:hypothetical protein
MPLVLREGNKNAAMAFIERAYEKCSRSDLLRHFLKLVTEPDKSLPELGVEVGLLRAGSDLHRHAERDWFPADGRGGYWPSAPIGPQVRRALTQALAHCLFDRRGELRSEPASLRIVLYETADRDGRFAIHVRDEGLTVRMQIMAPPPVGGESEASRSSGSG